VVGVLSVRNAMGRGDVKSRGVRRKRAGVCLMRGAHEVLMTAGGGEFALPLSAHDGNHQSGRVRLANALCAKKSVSVTCTIRKSCVSSAVFFAVAYARDEAIGYLAKVRMRVL